MWQLANRTFDEPICRFFFGRIVLGVHALHKNGIAHRDLKLSNIFIDEWYYPKIGDLGFAAPTHGRTFPYNGLLTTRLGTPGYEAPELLVEGKKIEY